MNNFSGSRTEAGGRPLGQQLQGRLFGPLGLQQTFLPVADDTAIPAPYSHGYMHGGSSYAMVDKQYPADVQATARAGTLQPIDYTKAGPVPAGWAADPPNKLLQSST